MSTPWLDIPLEDYERHMSLPGIGQAQMLAAQFEVALERWRPTSVAVVGCAGGNGLDRIDGRSVERLVAIDVNPDYVESTRARHSGRIPSLESICADVQSESLTYEPVDFTYAALLFEYVDVRATLRTLKRNSRSGAVMTTVLQLPQSTIAAVSPSPYKSLGALAGVMRLVAPDALCRDAADVGFAVLDSATVELASGKQFCMQNFRA